MAAPAASGLACSAKDATPPANAHALPKDSIPVTLTQDQRDHLRIAPVESVTFRPTVQTTGTVAFDGDLSTQVLAPMSGPVSRLVVEVGAVVHRGDPLAIVSSPDFAAAVSAYRKAQVTSVQTQRIADLDVQLFSNDALAKRDLEQAQTDAMSAAADRDAAIQQLKSLGVDSAGLEAIREGRPLPSGTQGILRSPIEGTVVERLITPGQLLQAGTTPCFTVADLSRVWVMASVFEADLSAVTVGERAEVSTSASPRPLEGTVSYVAALVDPNTRATSVRVSVPNVGRLLKRDMYVQVTIHSSRDRRGLLAPVSAVLRDEDNLPFVFVEKGNGTFARRQITLASRVGDRYEVAGGLSSGERVISEGGLFLQFEQSQ
ncbi:MAG TPA: efflux RND transporter periplasmic adaptor subunit [Gemmatimonadaceae bacterium]|nr:efflux RND transporter periplasmic adaptor subunit [Gemmatimonadaceae bacterium]